MALERAAGGAGFASAFYPPPPTPGRRERAAGGSDFERALYRRLQTAAERDVEREIARLHRNAGEAGRTEDAVHARLRGERERSGIFRPLRRQLWHVLVDRLQRRHEERIFLGLAPARERQPS